MRAAAAFALMLLACSQNAPPAPGTNPTAPALQLATPQAATQPCAACGTTYQIVKQSAAPYRVIAPEPDAADLARRLSRPDLEPALDEMIAAVATKVATAPTDALASAALGAFVADLERLAHAQHKL
jgi:hypothetical protein